MTLYHMKNDGTPGVCSAQPGNCPLSSSSLHTHTLEEAQDFADRMNEINALHIYDRVRLNSNKPDKDEYTTYLTENQIKKLDLADLYVLSKTDEDLEEESQTLIKDLRETETLLTDYLQKEYYLSSDKARADYEDNYQIYLFNKFKPDGYPLEIKNVNIRGFDDEIKFNTNVKISLANDLEWKYSYNSGDEDIPIKMMDLEKNFFNRPDVKPYADDTHVRRGELLKLKKNSATNSYAKLKKDKAEIKEKRIELEDKLDSYSRELNSLSERRYIQNLALNELKNRGY